MCWGFLWCRFWGILAGILLEDLFVSEILGVATPAEPRGEKKLFFVQILGGEKLLKFVEKCR